VLQECYKSATIMLLVCNKGVTRVYPKSVTRASQESYKGAKARQECHNIGARVQESYNSVQILCTRVLQKC
jgi:hypothetical protein